MAAAIQQALEWRPEVGRIRLVREKLPGWKINAESCADSPAWGLIRTGEHWAADLIVLGSRGHGVIENLLLGGVAQQVLANAPCSVRIVRPRPRAGDEPLRLVLGVDGSPDSEAALDAAASASRVLPIPGSPTRSTRLPRPPAASVRRAPISSSSRIRPTNSIRVSVVGR